MTSEHKHLTDINLQPHHHSSVKNPEQKNSPEIKTSGPTTMLSSLNCPHRSQLGSTALETVVTGELRITQVFRRRAYIRIPTHSATTSLTFGILSSNGPWCIIISEQRGEHRERYTDSGRPTETNIRRDPSRSALRLQATADPTGNLSQRFKTVCQPEGPAKTPPPTQRAGLSFIWTKNSPA